MPYTDAYMKSHVYARVLEQFGSDDNFQYWLADLIATAFNHYTRERLMPGHNSLAKDLRVDQTMPVDMYIDITAWWKARRAPHFKSIKRLIEARLCRQFPNLKIEVALNPPGTPPEQPIDFSERIEDIFLGKENERVRNCLMRSLIITLGDLVQCRAEVLLEITHFNIDCLGRVIAKLAERGLALAPSHR